MLTRGKLLFYCAIGALMWWGIWEAGTALARISVWDIVK